MIKTDPAGVRANEKQPVFEAYAGGDHAGALAMFMSAVSGLEWTRCRTLLEQRVPGAVAQAITDTDTFFDVELPALTEWEFGADQAAGLTRPVLSVLGGETQPLWVEVAEFLRSALPQVDERTIDGVGHLLHIQRPEPVAREMAKFLGRHPLSVELEALERPAAQTQEPALTGRHESPPITLGASEFRCRARLLLAVFADPEAGGGEGRQQGGELAPEAAELGLGLPPRLLAVILDSLA